MPEPKQPRAVYHPPEQEKPCEECLSSLMASEEGLYCGHNPLPEGLTRDEDDIDYYGTCDYWESAHD